ncbi:tumor necrosis factor b (TNF superfamily, member 2) [Chanos chanos]|uniref:Tumor necrosis factor n=1 Tax=Chanos chanos TaxID=29144 RepID=A0A6J2W0N8_CHACN|nr:tumor necrosis factor-like [Chanos chanos]
MVDSGVAPVDLECGSAGKSQVPTGHSMFSKALVSKLCGVAVFVTFCVVASFFFACHMTKQNQKEFQSTAQTSSEDEHQQLLKQVAQTAKAAVHLNGELQLGRVGDSILWQNNVSQAFSQGELRLENNEIIIPHPGLYFVYTQASYHVKCRQNSDDDEDRHSPVSLTVFHQSIALNGKKLRLLRSVKSVCQSAENDADDDENSYTTVYLGAVFQLHAKDKLSVESNHLTDIEFEPEKTFFGVFALGGASGCHHH